MLKNAEILSSREVKKKATQFILVTVYLPIVLKTFYLREFKEFRFFKMSPHPR